MATTASEPRLTVLIAAWDAAGRIERAIASVLDDAPVALECVVVDDGSRDGTAEVVRGIAARDPRVVLVALEENVGVSAARNRGLEHVRGEWLTFLDADDRLLPGAIAALMAPTADPDVRIVVGQRIWTDGERTWLSSTYDNPDVREPGRKSLATHPGLVYYASGTGKIFHRSVREGLRFEGRVLGDQPWTIRAMIRAGGGIHVVADTVYEWDRPRGDDDRHTITAAKVRSTERAIDMVDVAIGALAEVRAEASERLADPVARRRVELAYLDRLVRADLHGAVRRAVDRGDPGTDRLFRAIARFLAAVPRPLLAEARYPATHLLRPVAGAWPRLDPAARDVAWELAAIVLRAQPRAAYRVVGLPPGLPHAPAAAAARMVGTAPGRALGSVGLSLLVRLRDVGRLVRRRFGSPRISP